MAEIAGSSGTGIYCLGCSYDLRRLPENRCPECGRYFDPADSRTFRRTADPHHLKNFVDKALKAVGDALAYETHARPESYGITAMRLNVAHLWTENQNLRRLVSEMIQQLLAEDAISPEQAERWAAAAEAAADAEVEIVDDTTSDGTRDEPSDEEKAASDLSALAEAARAREESVHRTPDP